jgi:hypothetical protein
MASKWEQVVISWMNKKPVEYQIEPDDTTEVVARDDFQIVELEKLLLDKNIIPKYLCGNAELYTLLLRRMQLQLIYSVSVPERPMRCDFGYQMNGRNLIIGEIQNSIGKAMKELEHKTGVNLNHYWKIVSEEKGILLHKMFTKFVSSSSS